MQVSLDTTGTLERRLRVEVPEDRIATEVQSRLKDLSRRTRIDGFRPGKVPFKVVEKRFGTQVRQEVIGDVLRSTFRDAVVQEKLRPAGEPTIDPLVAEPGQGLAYTATFEVYPEVTVGPVAALEIERPVCEISDADLDAMTETLRQQRRTWEEVDRPAAEGDQVNVDFTGYVDGEPFEGGQATRFDVELGHANLIPGFESGLVGARAGEERELNLTFPENYGHTGLAGKPAVFKVQVNKVSEARPPAVDEAFFKLFDITEGGLERFRAELRENLERERDQLLRTRVKDRVMDALLAANTVEVPKALVESESRRLFEELKQTIAMRGADPAQIDGLDLSRFADQATKRVKLGLILSELIQANGLKLDPAKVRGIVEGLAQSYREPAAVVKWYYEDRRRLADVEAAALEEEVVSWVLERAAVLDVSTTFDALRNPGQTA